MEPSASVSARLATDYHDLVDKIGVMTQAQTTYNPMDAILWTILAVVFVLIAIFTRSPKYETLEFTSTLNDASINHNLIEIITPADKMNRSRITIRTV